jgi:hypothetical protein
MRMTVAELKRAGFGASEAESFAGNRLYLPTLDQQLRDQGLDPNRTKSHKLTIQGTPVTYYCDDVTSVFAVEQGWFASDWLRKFSIGIFGSNRWVAYGVKYFNNLAALQQHFHSIVMVEVTALAALEIAALAPSVVQANFRSAANLTPKRAVKLLRIPKDTTADPRSGTTLPRDLREKLGIDEASWNPAAGRQAATEMNDPRWPGSEGWVTSTTKTPEA